MVVGVMGSMFATLVGPSKPDDKQPIEPGDLVRVEIPTNCAVYATDPVSARDVARSWFHAGIVAAFGHDTAAFDLMFEKLFAATGIVLDGGES